MAEATAKLKNLQSSPRKMRYVADMVRGVEIERAMNILQHSPKHGAKLVEKLVRSAIDNWEKKNEGMRIEDAGLFIKTIFVDGGKTRKRWLPAPHGRAYKLRKRSNHITVVIDSKVAPVAETAEVEAPQEETVTTAPVETEVKRKPAVKKTVRKKAATAKKKKKATAR